MGENKSNLDTILDSVDMIDVMERYIDLKRVKDDKYIALCPFHSDKNPSFNVNPEKGVYHCFGCGASGNLITFLENINNESFIDAAKELGEISGIEFQTKQLSEQELKFKRRHELMNKLQLILQHTLFTAAGKEALQSIKDRGLTEKQIKEYGLGYCDEKSINRYFRANDINLDEQLQTKLVELKNGAISYPIDGRVTFMIKNIDGNPIGFSGGRIDKESLPKYKHSIFLDEGPGFFYQDNYFSNQPVTIVEGFYDQLSLSMSGINNVISTLGTSAGASNEKVKALLSKSNNFIICMDGDNPGKESAIKLAEMLKNNNEFSDTKVKLVLLPNALDPDDYRKKYSCDKLKEQYNKSLPLILFAAKYEINKAKEDNLDNEQLIKNLVVLTKYADDDIQREMYMNKLSSQFNLSEDALNNYLIQHKNKKDKHNNKENNTTNDEDNLEDNTIDELFSQIDDTTDSLSSIIDEPSEQALYIQEQSIVAYLMHHKEELNKLNDIDNIQLSQIFPHEFAYKSYLFIKKHANNNINVAIKSIDSEHAAEQLFLQRAQKLDVNKDEFESNLKDLENNGSARLAREDAIKDIKTDINENNDFNFDDYLQQLRSVD